MHVEDRVTWFVLAVVGTAGVGWLAFSMPFGRRTFAVMAVLLAFVLTGLFPRASPLTR